MQKWKEYIQDHLLTMAVWASIVGGACFSAYKIEMQAVYPTMVGALLALAGVHKGMDVMYDKLVPTPPGASLQEPDSQKAAETSKKV